MSADTELIKERLDIAEVVSEYVQLKRAGRYFKGLCPFHNEKTPSFIVSPDRGIWHCFGACGEGGDVFSFIQKIEGVDFPGALRLLADRAGVKLDTKPAFQQVQSRRQRLFDLLELTARFYHEVLLNQPAGRPARQYLEKRGVKEESLNMFQLGYAPLKWETLQNFLRSKGYAPREMLAAGVAGENDQGRLYDRFRGRIIFPIWDLQNRVVAFGGRIIPQHETGSEGKYVNSPETELYEKRRVVYNLQRAKMHLRHGTPCLVVEGYMDVVMVVQSGVENAVASSGTAFTLEQAAQIKRFTGSLHFAFDPDSAGLNAAVSATRAALTAGLRAATVPLPPGQDPADLAWQSPEKLKETLSRSQSLISMLIKNLEAPSSPREKEQYLEQLLPLVAAAANPVFQGELVQQAARALHVPEARIIEQLRRVKGDRGVEKEEWPPREEASESFLKTEQYALGLIIASPPARQRLLAGGLKESFFIDKDARNLYSTVQGLFNAQSAVAGMPPEEVRLRLPEHLVSYAEGLKVLAEERLNSSHRTPKEEGQLVLDILTRRRLAERLKNLQEQLSAETNTAKRGLALKKFRDITEKLARIETKK